LQIDPGRCGQDATHDGAFEHSITHEFAGSAGDGALALFAGCVRDFLCADPERIPGDRCNDGDQQAQAKHEARGQADAG
jgi:hypothetical protein